MATMLSPVAGSMSENRPAYRVHALTSGFGTAIPLGMPTFGRTIPTLAVSDLGVAVAFYTTKLGFRVRCQDTGFADVQRDEAELHLTPLNDEAWKGRSDFSERPAASGTESFLAGTGTCRIQVEGLDQLFHEYTHAGLLGPSARIREQWWGDRDFVVLDADRNAITFFEPAQLTGNVP